MLGLLIVGIFIIVVGVMLIIAPNTLSDINEFMNKKVFSDSAIIAHRLILAAITIVVGLELVYIYLHHILHIV